MRKIAEDDNKKLIDALVKALDQDSAFTRAVEALVDDQLALDLDSKNEEKFEWPGWDAWFKDNPHWDAFEWLMVPRLTSAASEFDAVLTAVDDNKTYAEMYKPLIKGIQQAIKKAVSDSKADDRYKDGLSDAEERESYSKDPYAYHGVHQRDFLASWTFVTK